MKIYNIITPRASTLPIEGILPGDVIEDFSGNILIVTNVRGADRSIQVVNLENGLAAEWLSGENRFTLRPDIVLTTDRNLRNKPE